MICGGSALRNWSIGVCLAVAAQCLFAAALPQPEAPFKGRLALNASDARAAWPELPQAPRGAPNIVIILLDDTGFAASSTFGGVAQTPALDRLAAQGLRYNNFNTTALCSPTRAALLSGRNHHRMGFGSVTETSSGFPGYNGLWKKSTVSVMEVLQRNGYSTSAFGKWHNTPTWEVSPVGPFERWPTGLGFDYFYGFMAGETSQWEPLLYRNTTAVDAPATVQQGYHFTTDITDDAIRWVKTQRALTPGRPYFMYFAPGATHDPHHAPQEWIERYRGRFDQGWDKLREETFARQKQLGVIPAAAQLTARPADIPAWDSLPADARRLFARQMEVFAGFLAHTDHEIGRLLDVVRDDNTLVLYIVGDNGGSPGGRGAGSDTAAALLHSNYSGSVQQQLQHIDELGGAARDNQYATGWAWATSTPFQGVKGDAAHFGGVRNPLVVAWPARIKDAGAVRPQFSHVNDVAATLYEVTGIAFPETVDGVRQEPLDGVSFAATFTHADAPSVHRRQYFEIVGNRSIYADGWIASARHMSVWSAHKAGEGFEHDRWELYHVAEDFSQARDLAAVHPQKLRELQQLFDREAHANNVYPLGTVVLRKSGEQGSPSLTAGRKEFVYSADTPRLPAEVAPDFLQAHRIVADVVIPSGGASGLLAAHGGRYGGFAWYVENDHLVYVANRFGDSEQRVVSSERLPRGPVRLACDFQPSESGGLVRLFIGERQVGEMQIERIGLYGFGVFQVGRAAGSPVSSAYQLPFAFSGRLQQLTVTLR